MSEIVVIDFYVPTGDCCVCGKPCPLDYCVGYYCGPTRDPIGSVTTEYTDGGIVGGNVACKSCHDRFYNIGVQAS